MILIFEFFFLIYLYLYFFSTQFNNNSNKKTVKPMSLIWSNPAHVDWVEFFLTHYDELGKKIILIRPMHTFIYWYRLEIQCKVAFPPAKSIYKIISIGVVKNLAILDYKKLFYLFYNFILQNNISNFILTFNTIK